MSKVDTEKFDVTEKPGGALEVTPKRNVQAEPQATDRLTRASQIQGPVHVEAATGKVTELGTDEFIPDAGSGLAGSVLGTLRTPAGRAVNDMREIDPDTALVDVHGMTTNLATAIHMGYVRIDAQGNYVDTGRAEGEIKVAQEAQSQPQQKFYLDPIMSNDAKSFVGQLKRNIGHADLADGMIVKAIQAAVLDKPANHIIDELASHAHLQDSADLHGDMETLVNDIQEHLVNEVKKIGGDPESVKWVMENCADYVKAGLLRRAYYGEGSCIKEIIHRHTYKNRK